MKDTWHLTNLKVKNKAHLSAPPLENPPPKHQHWTTLGSLSVTHFMSLTLHFMIWFQTFSLPIGLLLLSNHLWKAVGNFWPEDSTCLSWLDKQPQDVKICYICCHWKHLNFQNAPIWRISFWTWTFGSAILMGYEVRLYQWIPYQIPIWFLVE